MSVNYFACVSLGNKLLTVESPCTGHISTWPSLVGSGYVVTFMFGFGTVPVLLHQSAYCTNQLPRGIIACCFLRCSSFSLNGFCSAYIMLLGGAWYGLLSQSVVKMCFQCSLFLKNIREFSLHLFCHFSTCPLSPFCLDLEGGNREFELSSV